MTNALWLAAGDGLLVMETTSLILKDFSTRDWYVKNTYAWTAFSVAESPFYMTTGTYTSWVLNPEVVKAAPRFSAAYDATLPYNYPSL